MRPRLRTYSRSRADRSTGRPEERHVLATPAGDGGRRGCRARRTSGRCNRRRTPATEAAAQRPRTDRHRHRHRHRTTPAWRWVVRGRRVPCGQGLEFRAVRCSMRHRASPMGPGALVLLPIRGRSCGTARSRSRTRPGPPKGQSCNRRDAHGTVHRDQEVDGQPAATRAITPTRHPPHDHRIAQAANVGTSLCPTWGDTGGETPRALARRRGSQRRVERRRRWACRRTSARRRHSLSERHR